MNDSNNSLSRMLAELGRKFRWRFLAVALCETTIALLALSLSVALFASITLRGDLAAAMFPYLAVGGIGPLLILRFLRARRATSTSTAIAAQVLADLRSSPPQTRLLWHEVLGASELGSALTAGQERSKELAQRYIDDVSVRVAPIFRSRPPRIGPSLGARILAATALALVGLAFWLWPFVNHGVGLWLTGTDGRPPQPPAVVWSALDLALTYPSHTSRPPQRVPNPSGALRLPAGTEVAVRLQANAPAEAARVVVTYDSTMLATAPDPVIINLERGDDAGVEWNGAFTVRAGGSWTIVLLEDEDDEIGDESRRSAALPIRLEPDRPPEVECLPLATKDQEVRESDDVAIHFQARDDFGLHSAKLVYQLPEGTTYRLAIPSYQDNRRVWNDRYVWDISQIPISERSEVLYWIEVRDNDPGLGLVPLEDPPGKTARSATMRLWVQDEEAEHAANIAGLVELRDNAVDLLAERMTTAAFTDVLGEAELPLHRRISLVQDLHGRSTGLLTVLATTVDALSMDRMSHSRDVETLAGIHERLTKLHRTELELHHGLSSERSASSTSEAEAALMRLERHNGREVAQLEDEIIRLDDLVDEQIIARLESLVARLEATQRKLVDLLERLKAGDESARLQIEQLEQRRREDIRRIAEARAMLRKEIDEEFMNLDAFRVLEQMSDFEKIESMLDRGALDQALEQARGELQQVEQLRDRVQNQAAEAGAEAGTLSAEARARMQLLRELSRLQDDQAGLREETRDIHKQWRSKVGNQVAKAETKRSSADRSEQIRRSLEPINDARLGRDARRGLADAEAMLDELDQLAGNEHTTQLELAEAAQRLESALQRTLEGAESKEREGKAARRALERAQGLANDLSRPLPSPDNVLEPSEKEALHRDETRQSGLFQRLDELASGKLAGELPAPGKRALENAKREMGTSAKKLGEPDPQSALEHQQRAWKALQDAIDSLRQGSPPPPAAAQGDASTEADRDRSLRDSLMDAMREGAPSGFDESVKRYYEELLQ